MVPFGQSVFLGGSFMQIETPQAGPLSTDIQEARSAAQWIGDRLFSLRSGANDEVWAFEVFDDGSGPALYAAGKFRRIGATQANNIARWDGASWSALGSGLESEGGGVQSLGLSVFDDGSESSLFVAGTFAFAGGEPASKVAKWNGRSWSPLGNGLSVPSPVNILGGISMIVFDDGQGLGPALYVGGAFAQAGALASKQIARWQGCPSSPPCPTDLNGDSATDIADLLLILAAWGSCDGCIEDITGDDVVDLNDLLALLAGWGPCS